MKYIIRGPNSVIPMLLVFPGQCLFLTDKSGTTYKLGHAPGVYYNFGVASCHTEGTPAYPVILRVLPARHRFHSSRPEA